jgi:hypothetical protein
VNQNTVLVARPHGKRNHAEKNVRTGLDEDFGDGRDAVYPTLSLDGSMTKATTGRGL